MSSAVADLRTLSSRAGIFLKKRGTGRAGDDLSWAWRHLGAASVGRTIVEQLGADETARQLEALLGQPWETLELTAMSLGFGSVMTAIDLCADAVLLICDEPQVKPKGPGGSFYDLGDLRKRDGKLAAPPAIQDWVDHLLAPRDGQKLLAPGNELKLLKTCRDALVHRQVRPHPGVRWVNGRATRALAEITPLDSRGVVQHVGSIGDLVPRLVGFGEEQLEALCLAILQPWGG